MSFYLVERYVPSMSVDEVASGARRVAATGHVRHLFTVLVAGEDTCLSLFEAADATAVETANIRASFPLDRIVEVSLVEARGSGSLPR